MSNTEKNLVGVIIGLALVVGSVFAITHLLVDKVANKVIERLQKDYSPSPYGPGFDPDKVTPPKPAPAGPNPIKITWENEWDSSRK
jgi:hypothetical protein